VPTVPRPTFAVGYEGRMLEGATRWLNEQDGKRPVEAGVLEEAGKSKTRSQKK
jgi:hypothetical protein